MYILTGLGAASGTRSGSPGPLAGGPTSDRSGILRTTQPINHYEAGSQSVNKNRYNHFCASDFLCVWHLFIELGFATILGDNATTLIFDEGKFVVTVL